MIRWPAHNAKYVPVYQFFLPTGPWVGRLCKCRALLIKQLCICKITVSDSKADCNIRLWSHYNKSDSGDRNNVTICWSQYNYADVIVVTLLYHSCHCETIAPVTMTTTTSGPMTTFSSVLRCAFFDGRQVKTAERTDPEAETGGISRSRVADLTSTNSVLWHWIRIGSWCLSLLLVFCV